MSIEINGLEVLLGGLEKISNLSTVKDGITKATLLVERSAKQKAPKGELQQSITSKVDDFIGSVYTPLHYAPYLEYGTSIFADPTSGKPSRQAVPWVYGEGYYQEPTSTKIYTEDSARQMVAMMREEGKPAVMTYGQEPQPYLRPALDENREEIIRILGEAILNA